MNAVKTGVTSTDAKAIVADASTKANIAVIELSHSVYIIVHICSI